MEGWSVQEEALKVIEEIKARGRIPILVGGTHYYTQALLFNNVFIDDNIDVDEVGDLAPQRLARSGLS
jgi:tRNA dimethylallyltransferase